MATIPDDERDELLRGREETETEALAPHAEDGHTLPCQDCGARPWGYGYCGLYCERCAPLNMPTN